LPPLVVLKIREAAPGPALSKYAVLSRMLPDRGNRVCRLPALCRQTSSCPRQRSGRTSPSCRWTMRLCRSRPRGRGNPNHWR
jgi:hypothetical protein